MEMDCSQSPGGVTAFPPLPPPTPDPQRQNGLFKGHNRSPATGSLTTDQLRQNGLLEGHQNVSAATADPALPSTSSGSKRPASPLQGPSKLQRPDSPASSQSSQPPTSQPAKEKIPPIMVDPFKGWATHAAKLALIAGGDLRAVFTGKQYRLSAPSISVFRAYQQYLTAEGIAFYTFTPPRSRVMKVVISRLPGDLEAEELQDRLTGLGFAVGDCSRLRTRRGLTNLWVVEVLPDSERASDATRPAKDIFLVDRLFHLAVSVRTFERPKGPAQCHRCQGFFHGSSNCGRATKCVRCGGPHTASSCQKPSEEAGKCCNCGGDHNANYRGCPAYKSASKPAARGRGPAKAPRRKLELPARPAAAPAESEEDDGPEEDDGQTWAQVTRRRRRGPRNPANRPGVRDGPSRGPNVSLGPGNPERESQPPPDACDMVADASGAGEYEIAPRSAADAALAAKAPRGERRQEPTRTSGKPVAAAKVPRGKQGQVPARTPGPSSDPAISAEPALTSDAAVILRQVMIQLSSITQMMNTLVALLTPRHG